MPIPPAATNAAETFVLPSTVVVSAIYLLLIPLGPPSPVIALPTNTIVMLPSLRAEAYRRFPATSIKAENIRGALNVLFVQVL